MQEYRLKKTATNIKSGVGQHAGMMGQHEQEWWVNMLRNLQLSLYTKNGMLSIRPVALGRKNYLFAGSHDAARRSGMLYSLLGTCKMHGIEPYGWLKDVLQKIPTQPINKVQDLLPHYCLELKNQYGSPTST
jgi:hypothetical protein